MTGDLIAQRYRLGPALGQGGMGTIYRAHDDVLDRPVAVKVLNRAGLGTAGRARLLAEARSAARLNHPNIVSVYDAGETDGLAYIVMELVEGDTLHPRGDLAATVALVRQICAALAHAHGHGVIHRDLKPENVLVSADGTAKLSDFGLARSVSSRLTEDGAVAGTVFYLAPEILQGREIDGRADLYALGVMLYELTTGKLPFAGDEPVAIISQHLYAAPMPPRAHNPELPATLETVILRLLAKEPADRPATADEVARLLEHWDDGSAEPDTLSLLDRMVRGRMVGRERELAEASAAWRRALSGAGHVLLVSGEPGIGKTRLVRELSALARVSGAAVLRGECYVEGGTPYAPLAQILHSARDTGLLRLPGEPGADGAGLPPAALHDLLSLAPELLPEGERPEPWLDAQAQQVRQFEAAATLVQRLTTTTPLLIVLEDAHWADSGTLAAVRHLARRTQQCRVLIVVTYRETELDAACCLPDLLHDLQRERLATRVKLGRLGREQVRRLLAVMFGLDEAEINLELLDGLYRETEGNPFFLEEVCKTLIEDGQIYFADGAWRRAPSQALQIPQSVRLTIQARLSKLPEPAQDVLRLAAVFGREFDFDTLQTASGVAEPTLIEALEHASRAQIVGEVRNGHGLQFTFAHALIPSTLRESMSGPRLRLLHRRAVDAIEQRHPNDLEALAYHTSQAGDDARALGYFQRAGDRALSAYANQEAERHFSSALALVALGDGAGEVPQAPLKAGLGEALFRLSRFGEARRVLSEAGAGFIAAGNSDRAAAAVARAARAAWYEDNTALALEICLDGLKRIAPEPATPGLSALLHETGRAYLFAAKSMQDPPPEAGAYCRQGLELAERFGLVEIQAECLTTLGLTIGQATDEALGLFRQAIALTEPSGLLATAARAYFNLGGGELDQGHDLRAGVEDLRHASELYRRAGQIVQALEVALLVVDYDLTLGMFTDVERELARIRREARTLPQTDHLDLASAAIEVDLLTYRGEFELAAELLAHVTDHADRLTRRSPFVKPERLLLSRGILSFERDDRAAARAAFETSVAEDKSTNPGDAVAPMCLLALLDIRSGDFATAETRIAAARLRAAAASHHIFAPIFLNWAEAELARARDRQTEAVSHLEAAIAVASGYSARWFEARLRETCAAVLAARQDPGDTARADAELETIIHIYEALGATRHVARTHAARSALSGATSPGAP